MGKSTIAVNLALASARAGIATGILDTDIYGPSIPTLLGLEGLEPELNKDNRLIPLTAYGTKAMSMGSLVPKDNTIAWRGLMVQKAMNQLLFEVAWPKLDLLILDLPPGTGDVQLTITQSIKLTGEIKYSRHHQRLLTSVKVLSLYPHRKTLLCVTPSEESIFSVRSTCRYLV